MSKKSQRNKGRERNTKAIEAQAKLKKMRYYWIFSAVWLFLGVLLAAVGANIDDPKVDAAAAVRVGVFIVFIAVGVAIFGMHKLHAIKKQLNIAVPKGSSKTVAEPKSE